MSRCARRAPRSAGSRSRCSRSVGCHPQPIGSLTTFWEPHPLDAEVGLDTLGLCTPGRIDVDERVGYFGAGTTVREVDRLARAQGLCLVAYPDSDGTASVGSMAAVACTSGLGMARISPVEQIVGLTIVTPEATVLKTGASWRLGRGGIAHGMPDPTGMFLGSQGRFGVITEVVLTLAPAPYLAARSWSEPWRPPGALADALRRARQEMDRGTIDSLRLEAVCAGGAQPTAIASPDPKAIEWFVRCWAPESAESADESAAAVAERLGARDARGWVESAAGRRGELPDHDARYSLPPGTHHERTGREGFLGMEVNVNWGEQLDATLGVFADLFRGTRRAPDWGTCRLGIYPGPHTVSIGTQAMLSGGDGDARHGARRHGEVRRASERPRGPSLPAGPVVERRSSIGRRAAIPPASSSGVQASPVARVNGVHPALAFLQEKMPDRARGRGRHAPAGDPGRTRGDLRRAGER